MTPFERREAFHLLFFAAFADRFQGREYALKGGVCLRFYHRSPRLSEDIDMDIGNISLGTLQKGVEGIIHRSSFRASMEQLGVAGVTLRTAKATDTTQRWILSLEMGGDAPSIVTRLECSRRRSEIPFAQDVPAADLLARYSYRPFSGQFYAMEEMVFQKTDALAAVRRHALRDLFDLDLLLTHGGVVWPAHLKRVTRQAAAKKVISMTWAEFQSDVLPYLSDESRPAFHHREAFDRLVERVTRALT